MRQGIAPDGSYYFPVFPYVYFSKLTDKDVEDIFAYLQHVPPVRRKDRPVDMPIPFRWRWMQFFWRLLYFKPYAGVYRPDPHESAQWNRGRYIVSGLGHCAMCHTPMNRLGAPQRQYNLTGAFVEGFYAPNITSTHLDDFTKKQILHVFLHYKLLGGGKLEGPMREVDHESLRHLSKGDLRAIAVYLRSVKSRSITATAWPAMPPALPAPPDSATWQTGPPGSAKAWTRSTNMPSTASRPCRQRGPAGHVRPPISSPRWITWWRTAGARCPNANRAAEICRPCHLALASPRCCCR